MDITVNVNESYKVRITESPIVKWTITSIAVLFLSVFLLLPLVIVFKEAFNLGISVYVDSIKEADSIASIKLSLIAALSSLILNLIFGVSAAWAITKFQFKGKSFLVTLLDLPFTISPVISGMLFVLLLGSHGLFGKLLSENNIEIIFAVPGIILVTTFVTFPYIARELIPHMQEIGKEEEEAAKLLGARGFKIFLKVTLPNIKWSLLYGVILCNARAMGEFGAVSVVSGHIRGLTNTMPLHIEILYNEYNFTGAFAVASLLTFLAVITLVVKTFLEWKNNKLNSLSNNSIKRIRI